MSMTRGRLASIKVDEDHGISMLHCIFRRKPIGETGREPDVVQGKDAQEDNDELFELGT